MVQAIEVAVNVDAEARTKDAAKHAGEAVEREIEGVQRRVTR
jgi:hypothetical protein